MNGNRAHKRTPIATSRHASDVLAVRHVQQPSQHDDKRQEPQPLTAGPSQVPFSVLKNLPCEVDANHQAHLAERVLLMPDAGVHRHPVDGVRASQLGEVAHEQDRQRDQQVRQAPHELRQRLQRRRLRQDNEDHDRIAQVFEPALERNVRVIGPSGTDQAIAKVNQQHFVVAEKKPPVHIALGQDDDAGDDQRHEDRSVHRAAFVIAERRTAAQPQPGGKIARPCEEHPQQGKPERRRGRLRLLGIRPEEIGDKAKTQRRGNERGH